MNKRMLKHKTGTKGRVCAWCGKDGTQGDSLVAMSLVREWCVEVNVKLKQPSSRYFDPRCARKAIAAIAKASK